MKKSIKFLMAGTLLIASSIFVYARQDTYWLCEVGSGAHCIYNPLERGFDCFPPPMPVTNGDCNRLVEVIIPSTLP